MRSPLSRDKTPPMPTFTTPRAVGTTVEVDRRVEWHSPVLLGASTIGRATRRAEALQVARRVTESLAEDAYGNFLASFYSAGVERFGERWEYADISTTLVAASSLAKPKSYLEIGVRRGRSMAMVSSQCPEADFVGFDMWIAGYGGNENPGAGFVQSELRRLGHRGSVEMIDGDSHRTVPRYFAENPGAYFDLITVDGDHSPAGATADLECVIPRLRLGGVLVFDDICHPAHPELAGVWAKVMERHPELTSWEFTGIGFGVAVAVRMY